MIKGQLLPEIRDDMDVRVYNSNNLSVIRNELYRKEKPEEKRIQVFVSSANKLKVEAAEKATNKLLLLILGEKEKSKWKVETNGIECDSKINEQPYGFSETMKGANNRLEDLKKKISLNPKRNAVIKVLVSMENGIIEEIIESEMNPDHEKEFIKSKGLNNKVLCCIDRCLVICEFHFENYFMQATIASKGVTTPFFAVVKSTETKFNKTCGSFIGEKYKVDPKDWHAVITGKTRKEIMEEAVASCMGVFILEEKNNLHSSPSGKEEDRDDMEIELERKSSSVKHANKKVKRERRFPVPKKTGTCKPDVYHDYSKQKIMFFDQKTLSKMLDVEMNPKATPQELEDVAFWREYFKDIPQPSKSGADGKNPPNSLGPILTTDILPIFVDRIKNEKGEIVEKVFIVLTWAKQDSEHKEMGWVLPGKRDRAYSLTEKQDISIEDSSLNLVEKELALKRTDVRHIFKLCYFDDRMRDNRMKVNSSLECVILKRPPNFEKSGKLIALPYNAFVQLVQHEIKIPNPQSDDNESYGFVWNHDSLLYALLNSNEFQTKMQSLFMMVCKWREHLKNDSSAQLPPFPEIEYGNNCPICADLFFDSKIVCKNGHTICDICSKALFGNNCPECRSPLLHPFIKNLALDELVKSNYPMEYAQKYLQINGSEMPSFRYHEMFNADFIQY